MNNPTTQSGNDNVLLCAAARAEITPEVGAHLSGYVGRRQPSTGFHDPLFAHALWLESGGGRLLWLHAEVVAFERADVQRLKATLAERHGLAEHEVIVTASHTHSGPATARLLRCGDYDAAAAHTVFQAFEALTAEALARPEPVEMVFGEGTSDLAIHRRPSDNPHTDPRLPVLGFRRAGGEYVAVLALYAMHNVAMSGENTLISADMAGRAARAVSEALPGRPPVLWVNGACGNTNPPTVGPDFERMNAWGDDLAAAALAALETAVPVEDTAIRAALDSGVLAPDPLSAAEVDAIVERQKRGAGPPTSASADWVRIACHAAMDDWRGVMNSAEGDTTPDRRSAPVDIHAIRLGPAVWVGVGAEVFSNLNDDLRADTGANVYVVGYANGDAGYLCTETAYDEGGYEPDGAFIYYGTRPIPRNAYARLRAAANDLITRLSGG